MIGDTGFQFGIGARIRPLADIDRRLGEIAGGDEDGCCGHSSELHRSGPGIEPRTLLLPPPFSLPFWFVTTGERNAINLDFVILRRKSMNNSELAEALTAAHGLTKADARKLVDAVFAEIADAAAKGEEISLNGFGKFKVKDTPAREGRNPATGETISIKASKKLAFTPAKAVKDRLNG
ncbi:MAG TPA: HU family DNA-binding protein [Sphingobium sp.]|uniref:HU family DNA-binding protein n=1 Tax=Sphingobium sp. TaxID=1912891 RepID=UPI002ED2856B